MEQQLTREQLEKLSPEQLLELQKKNCIFCKIVSGELQSKKIYEDSSFIAILDINPLNPGHCLVMPKQHISIMPQMSDSQISEMAVAIKSVSHKLLRGLKAQGTNVFIANGAVAGQQSPHFMSHVVPRKDNDGLKTFELEKKSIDKAELQAYYKIVKQSFEALLKLNHGDALKNSTSAVSKQEQNSANIANSKDADNNSESKDHSSNSAAADNRPNSGESNKSLDGNKSNNSSNESSKSDGKGANSPDVSIDDIARLFK